MNCLLAFLFYELYLIMKFPSLNKYISEDGSESYSSSDEEDADHHLLSKPAGEIVHSNDDSSGIARGVM